MARRASPVAEAVATGADTGSFPAPPTPLGTPAVVVGKMPNSAGVPLSGVTFATVKALALENRMLPAPFAMAYTPAADSLLPAASAAFALMSVANVLVSMSLVLVV